jgi:hypothetical protein
MEFSLSVAILTMEKKMRFGEEEALRQNVARERGDTEVSDVESSELIIHNCVTEASSILQRLHLSCDRPAGADYEL